ncbi:MAG: metal transporter [Bryobacterales bacterium]|nr:metal transporter [Bryobacterales bacterium]
MNRLWLALLLVATLSLAGCEGKKDADDNPRPNHASTQKLGEGVVELSPAEQNLAGIRTQTLSVQSWTPEIVAYGRLEEDPASSFILRAPVTGTLSTAPKHRWPEIGDRLATGADVGSIQPLFTPGESVGLSTQLATAQSDVKSAKASLATAQSAYERARVLNADQQNVADRVVQEALAALESNRARYAAATATERVLNSSLQAGRPLRTERSGEVAEILVQPGESVQAGAPILRVAKFNHLLARISVPVGEQVAPGSSSARIVPAGSEDNPALRADRIAISAAVDPNAQGTSFLFRLLSTSFGLRPGAAVTAYIPSAASARRGIVIPQSAVVRVEARPYVYLQTGPASFERRPVSISNPREDGYFVTSGFASGDRTVTNGAQTVLSEEFKSQMRDEE